MQETKAELLSDLFILTSWRQEVHYRSVRNDFYFPNKGTLIEKVRYSFSVRLSMISNWVDGSARENAHKLDLINIIYEMFLFIELLW